MIFTKQIEFRRNVAPVSVKNKKSVYTDRTIFCLRMKDVHKLS